MEYIDIVDEQGIPTGETIERSIAHSKGIRHIWIAVLHIILMEI